MHFNKDRDRLEKVLERPKCVPSPRGHGREEKGNELGFSQEHGNVAVVFKSSGAVCRVKTNKLFCLSTVASQVEGAGAGSWEGGLIAWFGDELSAVVVNGELVEQVGGMSASYALRRGEPGPRTAGTTS